MLRCFFAVLALLCQLIAPAFAQDAPRSECLAMANGTPRAMPVSLRLADAKAGEVTITYAGHSTYYIDTPGESGSRPTIAALTRWAGCPKSSP